MWYRKRGIECGGLKRLILCVTGMPGSGKTTVAYEIKKMGFHYVSLGDVVREQTILRGYDVTDANCGIVMMALRKELGPQAIAQLSLKHIVEEGGLIVVDGIRSIDEVNVFRSLGEVKLLAVHASPKRRFELLASRERVDAPKTREEFDMRDRRELDVGVGDVIALADEIISNDSTIEELAEKVKKQVDEWMRAGEG
ncbi:MAG: AAA family ATPase [Nitrososphaeria archaeon]